MSSGRNQSKGMVVGVRRAKAAAGNARATLANPSALCVVMTNVNSSAEVMRTTAITPISHRRTQICCSTFDMVPSSGCRSSAALATFRYVVSGRQVSTGRATATGRNGRRRAASRVLVATQYAAIATSLDHDLLHEDLF